jgi:hypothetical protein
VRDAASAKGRKAEMTDSKPPSDSEEWQDEKWYDRTRYQVLLFVGGIVLFGLVLGLILDWYIDPQTSTQKKDLVQALGLITAGVAGAIGIFFTWRGQRITQEGLQGTRKQAEENIRLAEQGQLTERFTRAIDQLGATDDHGNPRLEIRLGGIYALERIDKESPERAYHSTVMEVLTAYVREHSKGDQKDAKPTLRRPAPEIHAIVDVLRRREEEHVPKQHHIRLDLREVELQRANFQGADLQGAYLQGASLQGAFLASANLQEADLFRADLRATSLQEANLQGARLYKANLQGANCQGANLQRANLAEPAPELPDKRWTPTRSPARVRSWGRLPRGRHRKSSWTTRGRSEHKKYG